MKIVKKIACSISLFFRNKRWKQFLFPSVVIAVDVRQHHKGYVAIGKRSGNVRNVEFCRFIIQHPSDQIIIDLFSAFSVEPHLVCANLPYIPTETCRTIEPARFEPMSALDGGADGFELYRLLFAQLTNKIKGECLILCEIEYRQRELALETAESYFPGRSIRVLDDLAGQPRILEIRS